MTYIRKKTLRRNTQKNREKLSSTATHVSINKYYTPHDVFLKCLNHNYGLFSLVCIFCLGYGDYDPYFGFYPLTGHSLSWQDAKRPSLGPNNTMTAKIWRPEDPRETQKLRQQNRELNLIYNSPQSERNHTQTRDVITSQTSTTRSSCDLGQGRITAMMGEEVVNSSMASVTSHMFASACRTYSF